MTNASRTASNVRCWLTQGLALLVLPATIGAQDLTGDGKPDLVWRRTNGGDTGLWRMNGRTWAPPPIWLEGTGNDAAWKICAIADFSNPPDGKADLLWRHELLDLNAVWFMSGATVIEKASIGQYASHAWQIVGAGDFGKVVNGVETNQKDGMADIVWQNNDSGEKAFWFMDGTNFERGVTFDRSTPAWKIVAVGDFGSKTNSVPDGNLDLVLVNFQLSQVAIRFMDGPWNVDPANPDPLLFIKSTGAMLSISGDQDLRIVSAADYTLDGKTDLVLRHMTDGRNIVWEMNGTNWLGQFEIVPHSYDKAWRMAGQDLTESSWRFRPTGSIVPRVGVSSISSTRLDLAFIDFPGTSFTIERAPAGSGSFVALASGWTSRLYSDTTVAPGTRYDYRVTSAAAGAVTVTAASEWPPIHQRGRILLIVEGTLAAQLGGSLDMLRQDLAGDGWTVILKADAPRHHDPWDSADATNVAALKAWITSQYQADRTNTKCVFILGHVTIPYSGSDTMASASDGHADHQGPWVADLYYADVDGPAWTARTDGRFQNDSPPSPIELAIGRVDLTRLPSFGTSDSSQATAAEAGLIQQYIRKNNRYRKRQSPFPVQDRGIFTTYFLFGNQRDTAMGNAVAFFGDYASRLDIAEPFRDNSGFRDVSPVVPYLWAFTDGGGHANAIYTTTQGLEYTTPMLRANPESPIVFWTLEGSYFADFNFPDDLPRAIIAQPNYSLAVLPNSTAGGAPVWRLDSMALGEHIGAGFVTSVNDAAFRYRWLNLVGDPTLRLNTITPPLVTRATRNGSAVTVRWNGGGAGLRYYVYRAQSLNGPFALVTTGIPGNPVTSSPWRLDNIVDDPARRVYMVRAAALTMTGRGSVLEPEPGCDGVCSLKRHYRGVQEMHYTSAPHPSPLPSDGGGCP